MLILRSLKLEPNHASGISQFLQQQSDSEFLVDNGSLYPALQRLLQREWISRTVEDFAQRAPRPVLEHNKGRTQATGQGNFEVAAIYYNHGKDSVTEGEESFMRQWWSKLARALGRRRNLANELQQEEWTFIFNS